MKKAWDAVSVTRPRSEALVMPTVVERATQSPRVYVYQALGTPYYI